MKINKAIHNRKQHTYRQPDIAFYANHCLHPVRLLLSDIAFASRLTYSNLLNSKVALRLELGEHHLTLNCKR